MVIEGSLPAEAGLAADEVRAAAQLSLDFANTAEWHAAERPVESLTDFGTLLVWARQHGLVSERRAQALAEQVESPPERATTALSSAIELREAIYHLFRDASHGHAAAAADLAVLNQFLAEAMGHLSLTATERGFAWEWEEVMELGAVLWPIARAAADLLTSPLLSRVRECAGDPCGWLFLDESRNRSRRWCAMSDCGNRAKARRHYQRARTAKEGAQTG